ncbi:MAG: hypothetical protein ACOYVG_01135 [Bacteroidota bacterium]
MRNKIPVLIFILISQILTAQEKSILGMVNITPPTAAALGKYIDIPVNNHTGIPNIAVPLYMVKTGSLTLPVSLSYHASGLKVQEQASWVGAGWSLNAGGVITRTVRGTPDERLTNGLQQKYGHVSDSGYLSYLFKDLNGQPLSQNASSVGVDIREGRADGEADLFFFNVNGVSGKFYISDSGVPMLFPEQDVKIEYVYTSGLWYDGPGPYTGLGRCIERFILTTTDGTKYHFGMMPTIPETGFVQPIEVTSPYSLNNGPTYSRCISSWHLYKVEAPDGVNSILLKYKQDSYAYYNINAAGHTLVSESESYNAYDLSKNLVDGVRISQIQFNNGYVNFVPGNLREDLSAWGPGGTSLSIEDYANTISPSLGSLEIKDNKLNGFCKKYEFTYGYFYDNTSGLPPFLGSGLNLQSDRKRLKLLSVQEKSCDTTEIIPPFQFEYYDEPVPRTLSFGMDHWGFINGQTNTDLLPQITKNGSPYMSQTQVANRESGWPAMRGGTLKKITYPTNGFTEYEYEPNLFYVNNIDRTVGGLRIKQIRQSSGATPDIITSFSYSGQNGLSTGILYGKPVYVQKVRNELQRISNTWGSLTENGCWPTQQALISRNSLQPMAITQGYHIGYAEVKISSATNGYSIFRYYGTNPWEVDRSTLAVTNFIDNSSGSGYGSCDINIPNFPAAPLPNDFKRGELKFEGYYAQSGQAISEKEYAYVYQENPIGIPGYLSANIYSGELITVYELKTAKKISSSVTERSFDLQTAQSLQSTANSYYESIYHNQLTRQTNTDSKGGVNESKIKYAADYVLPSILSMTGCSYQAYQNINGSFPSAYYNQLSSCYSLNDGPRYSCIGTVWYWGYLKALSDARKQYISCIRSDYFNKATTTVYQQLQEAGKSQSDALLKPILWMQDNFMILPVETTEWKNGQLKEANIFEYSNDRGDEKGVFLKTRYRIPLINFSGSYTYAAISGNGTTLQKDNRFVKETDYEFNAGKPISITNRNGIANSYQWGYNFEHPTAQVINAAHTLKEKGVPGQVTKTSSYYIGGSISSSGDIVHQFNQTESGDIVVSLPSAMPPGANLTCYIYLTGTENRTGYICYTNNSNISCGGTASSVTFSNIPTGIYTLTFNVHTSFSSYIFNSSLQYSHKGMLIQNIGIKEFFYEGFEESENANSSVAHTGEKSWTGNYTTTFQPPNGKSYVIEWWSYNGSKWIANQQNYQTGMTIQGTIDNIRIFPSDAQMNTYTYKPLIGIEAEINSNNQVLFYRYDKLGRLKSVVDKDGNILKTFDYQYKQNQY